MLRLLSGLSDWYGGGVTGALERLAAYERDAEQHGHTFIGNFLRMTGWQTLALLSQGRIAEARAEFEADQRSYLDSFGATSGDELYADHHVINGHVLTRSYLALYDPGGPERARDILGEYDRFWRSPWRHIVTWRNHFYQLEPVLRLTVARRSPEVAAVARDRVAAIARRSAREDRPHCDGHAAAARANLALFDGDRAGARIHLRRAEDCYADIGMLVNARAARRTRGLLTDGAEGEALVSDAERWMIEHGMCALERLCGVYFLSPDVRASPPPGPASPDAS